MLYILKMLLKRTKCKVAHLILRISSLKWNLSVGNDRGEWNAVELGSHAWDNYYDSTAQCNDKNQVKNVSIDLVLWRWRTIYVIVQSSCGRVNKIPITCTQSTWDHARANTEEAEQKNWDIITQSANNSSL